MRRADSESSEEVAKVITIRSRAGGGGDQRRSRRRQQQRRGDDEEEEKPDYNGWKKTRPSKQDEINAHPEQIKEKLFDFERVPEEKYETVEEGTFIRYIRYDKNNRPQLRLGGYMIKNGYPDYWVLKAGSRGRRPITWSVPLKGDPEKGIPANEYYTKKGLLHNREDRTRYALEVYDALKSGRYMLIPTQTLETLTGEMVPGRPSPRQRRRPRKNTSRFELEDHSDELEDEEEYHVPIRARFRDNSESDSRRTTSEDDGWY
jgi:hypothetical protein